MPRNGAFAGLQLHDLAAPIVHALLKETGLTPEQVGEIITSNALGAGGNPARLVSLGAGLPQQIAGSVH